MGHWERRVLCAQVAAAPLLMMATAAAAQTPASPPAAASPQTPLAQPADASATQLQEVVVTATKTGAQLLQRTAESVSVATGQQLVSGGINDIKDLSQFVPNTSFSQNTAHAEIYIRGVGSDNIGVGSDPDVTTQIDGVYIARPSAQLADFIDVDRVEVLRGPQGTLYGRNAAGGTINIISRQPTSYFTGQTILSGGDYGYFQGQAFLSGPLADKLQASLAFNYVRNDPYFKNIAPGGQDVGGASDGGIKGQLRWEPLPDIDATTRADFSYKNDAFESYSQPLVATRFPSLANTVVGQLRDVALNDPQMLNSLDGGVSEEINWRFAPHFNLKSITAYRFDYFHLNDDNDDTEQELTDFHTAENDRSISQEFNVQYNSDRLKAVGGVFVFHDNDRGINTILVPPSLIRAAASSLDQTGKTTVDSTSGAAFGQGTYFLTSTISATVGMRYTLETKTLDQEYTRTSLNPATLGGSFPGYPLSFGLSKDFNAFTPKFGLNWQITPDDLLYVSATKGYKSGGFNYAAASAATSEFAPEKIWSYEIGAKTEWLQHRLRINVDGFYYDYSNLQVQQLIAQGVASIGNAATAVGRGMEVELVGKPSPFLQLTANFSILDAKYGNFPNASVPQALIGVLPNETCTTTRAGPSCTVSASGNYLNNAPTSNAVGAIDYSRPVFSGYLFSGHVDYTWRSRTYFDPSNALVLSQGAYGLFNAQVALETADHAWRVQLFGKNLTDKAYAVTSSAAGIIPAALVGAPRTYGVRVLRSW